jgi:hypothetical protein
VSQEAFEVLHAAMSDKQKARLDTVGPRRRGRHRCGTVSSGRQRPADVVPPALPNPANILSGAGRRDGRRSHAIGLSEWTAGFRTPVGRIRRVE